MADEGKEGENAEYRRGYEAGWGECSNTALDHSVEIQFLVQVLREAINHGMDDMGVIDGNAYRYFAQLGVIDEKIEALIQKIGTVEYREQKESQGKKLRQVRF